MRYLWKTKTRTVQQNLDADQPTQKKKRLICSNFYVKCKTISSTTETSGKFFSSLERFSIFTSSVFSLTCNLCE